MMYCIFSHANDLSFRIFPQAQEQFSGALIVQKFLPRNRLDLIQVDQIEPNKNLYWWLVLKSAFLSRFYIIILHLKYQ